MDKMTTQFDFNNITDLGTFWDGGTNAGGMGGGHQYFNMYNNVGSGHTDNIQRLYQNLVGRNSDPSGQKYWEDQLTSGAATYQTVADTLKASDEYKDQQAHLAANPNATGNELKNLSSAYISPFAQGSGSAMAGWKPGDAITASMADAISGGYTDQTNTTVGSLGGGGQGGGGSAGGINADQWNTFMDKFNTLSGNFNTLKDSFDTYKTQSAQDMQNVWNNANWGQYGQNQTVKGVRTQNELPGWSPKKGGSAGFFGRGGNRFGLTTSSLNI